MQALATVLQDTEGLSLTIGNTSELSERVSRKVRGLDITTCRVKECVEQTEHLLHRARAASGAEEALQRGDYENSADCIKIYFDAHQRLGDANARSVEQEQVLLAANCLPINTSCKLVRSCCRSIVDQPKRQAVAT